MIEKAILLTTSTDAAKNAAKIKHIANSLSIPSSLIELHINERDVVDPVRGCFNSHLNAYKSLLESEASHCLILEDDVKFLRKVDPNKVMRQLPGNWELFYFGHRPVYKQKTFIQKTENYDLVRVRTNDRHAFMISRKYAEKVVKIPWNNKNGDVILRNNSSSAFAMYPMVAVQSGKIFSQSFSNGLAEKMNEFIVYSKQNSWLIKLIRFMVIPMIAIFWFFRLTGLSLASDKKILP